jgi:two-component system, cell cycle sensor histidine kinase and response regulator CckA
MKGYQVLVAANGALALEIAAKHPGEIDMLITDLRMPVMDGKNLAARLCQIRPGVRILYISGYSDYDPNELIRCNNNNGAFLKKPFTGPDLYKKVEEIFEADILA